MPQNLKINLSPFSGGVPDEADEPEALDEVNALADDGDAVEEETVTIEGAPDE